MPKAVELKSLYLMGQLVGPDGASITGNGLYPLTGFPLALPELSSDKLDDSSPVEKVLDTHRFKNITH